MVGMNRYFLYLKMQKENVDPIGFGLRYRIRNMGNDD
jgi:spore germination protein KC